MPTSLSESDIRLVDAYLRHYATGDSSLLWAFDEVNDVTHREAERGLSITVALIHAAPNDEAFGYVVAGPLEEVLEVHGAELMDRVEELALTDGPFRAALARVVCFEDSMPTYVRDKLTELKARI